MRAWCHQKDYLILFKMIPYLLWLCPSGKGQYFKIWNRVSIEKLQNERQWSWRVNKEHVPLCGVMFFVLSWSAHQQHEDGGARRWCRHLGRPTDTEPWCHWNQWTLMKSKIPVTISIKIHANQAPATSFVSLLWLMWFSEIKWFESSF